MRDTLVVGTAGHIDHGKTSLVKHLTGIDADRLADEKRRGITIELGFAYLRLNDQQLISFVDVPGHERFVKSMLAGAMGMDVVMLVVAADEGFKPQTYEHLNILSHLNVKKGIVVITKCDLVTKEDIEYKKAEIHDILQDTFMAGAPIVEYSIKDDNCKRALVETLESYMIDIDTEVTHTSSRLSVDRVFSMKGHGTVVTGTLIEGKIRVGEIIKHYPSNRDIRVKGIQVHGENVEEASFGQRVALNLAVDKEYIERGDVLSSSDQMRKTQIVDVRLKTDVDIDAPIKHWQRLRLYHGTREILCRIAIKDQKSIGENEELIVQLRLESPLFCKINDPIIIRNFSPVITLGGGRIVNTLAKKHALSDADSSVDEEVLKILENIDQPFEIKDEIYHSLPFTMEQCMNAFERLIQNGELLRMSENSYATVKWWLMVENQFMTILMEFHKDNALRSGMDRETLRSKLNHILKFNTISKGDYGEIISKLVDEKKIEITGQLVKDPNHKVQYSVREKNIMDRQIQQVTKNDLKPTAINELIIQNDPKKLQEELLYHLINSEILVKISEEAVLSKNAYSKCRKSLLDHFEKHEFLAVAEFRDLLDISRKASVEILEHFDRENLTKRIENTRILIK
ncbi:MAG: selenocysteine-specific translation elongation factor [Clostridia bacterium]|nr:selenocysteine-specific translation elongation factor [Clostridia bacterium]